jgi:hypothetical protein
MTGRGGRHDEIRDELCALALDRGLWAATEVTRGTCARDAGRVDLLIETPTRLPIAFVEVKSVPIDHPTAVWEQVTRYQRVLGTQYRANIVAPDFSDRAYETLQRAGFNTFTPDQQAQWIENASRVWRDHGVAFIGGTALGSSTYQPIPERLMRESLAHMGVAS